MTTSALPVEAPTEAFELHEGAHSTPSPIDESGRVLVHIIRPCIGRGRGRHLYGPDMLQEAASQFAGWPMYVDHLSPEARKAAGGLPRSLNDVGGVVEESWWDPNVPADHVRGFGSGAVVGYARPFGLAKRLIEHDPRLVEASISANATGVRPVATIQEAAAKLGLRIQEARQQRPQQIWDVLGIAEDGSVDWVTKAGAGGRVVSLMEAMTDDDADDMLEALDEAGFSSLLERERPHLMEALRADGNTHEEANMGDTLTPEALQEALQSEGALAVLTPIIQPIIDARVEEAMTEVLPGRVEEAVAAERDLIRAEADARADRQVALRDMRDAAHEKIDEAKLPPSWTAALKGRFDLQEGKPTGELDVADELDADGKVTKPASTALAEAVVEAIKEQRTLLAEARPTRVRGQGAVKPTGKSGDGDKNLQEGDTKEESPYAGTLVGSVLQEAHIDASTAWTRQRA